MAEIRARLLKLDFECLATLAITAAKQCVLQLACGGTGTLTGAQVLWVCPHRRMVCDVRRRETTGLSTMRLASILQTTAAATEGGKFS